MEFIIEKILEKYRFDKTLVILNIGEDLPFKP